MVSERPWEIRLTDTGNNDFLELDIVDSSEKRINANLSTAEHIVKCVNMHEALVGALEILVDIVKQEKPNLKLDKYEELLKRAKENI